jgi:hypothetical protein
MDPNIAYGAIAAWLVNKLWDAMTGNQEENVEVTKANVAATQALTIAVVKLETKFEAFTKQVEKIPEIERDLNKLGSKVRDMQLLKKS